MALWQALVWRKRLSITPQSRVSVVCLADEKRPESVRRRALAGGGGRLCLFQRASAKGFNRRRYAGAIGRVGLAAVADVLGTNRL